MQVLTRWLWAGWGRALQRRRGTWRRSPPAHQAHQGVGSRQMAAGQHARLGSSRVCAVAAAAHQLLPGAALHAGLRKRVAELIKLGEKRAKNGAPPQMRTQRAVQPRPHIGPPRKPFAARTGGGVAAGRVARPSAHQCTGSRTRAHTPCPPPPPAHPTPPHPALPQSPAGWEARDESTRITLGKRPVSSGLPAPHLPPSMLGLQRTMDSRLGALQVRCAAQHRAPARLAGPRAAAGCGQGWFLGPGLLAAGARWLHALSRPVLDSHQPACEMGPT